MKLKIFKNAWELLRDTGAAFSDDKALKLSASLAYYTIFSLAPMLIVIISLCSLFFGREAIEGKVYHQIHNYVGNDAALQIQQVIKNTSLSGNNFLASSIGIATLIIGATGVFAEIQDSINIIWGIKVRPKRGWLKLLANRLISFLMVISIGFILIVSLVVDAIVSAFGEKLSKIFPDFTIYLFQGFNIILTLSIITLLFAIIFKVLPDAKIHWKDVIVGSIFTAVLFIIGKLAIGYYLGHSSMGIAYGAAGSLIILLVWVYYSSIILYFGAEFTQIYSRRHGFEIKPTEYSTLIKVSETGKDIGYRSEYETEILNRN